MDGLTIFQAVVGGIQVIGKIYEAGQKLRDAPDSIQCLMTEIVVTRSILERLRPLIEDDEYYAGAGAQHVGLDDLVFVFTQLVRNLSGFDKFITQVSSGTGLVATKIGRSSLWVKNERKFKRDAEQLRSLQSSLSTLLMLFERKDRIEDRRKLDSCQEEISRLHHQLQQQTLSLQTLDPETHQQIQTASYESCAPSILAAKSICASIQEVDLESDGERDATHEARTSSDNESLRTMIPISDFKVDTDLEDKPLTDLDRLLFLQRPYRAARRRSSLASFDSAASDEKKVAWSWISSVSAAEVSNLSLFELPIQKADLFRPHVWEAGQTATPDASLVIATQSYTTRSQHHLDHTSRSLHNAVGRADKFLVKALPNRFKSRRSIQLYILNQNCRAAQSNIKDESTIEDAKDILKGALDGYMHLHDPNGVIDSVQKLEAIYRRQEKLGDVEEIYARVLDFCKDALGCEHKATLELAHDLSCIYGEQGKMDEAAHLSERILEWDQSNAPNNKRIKAHAAYNLGLIYSAEDKFDRAEKILTDALNVFQNTGKVRGQDREEFILETGTMHLLANISRKQGKDQDFENMRLRASDKYRKSGLYKAETNVHGDPGLANDAWKHFGTEEASSMYAGITRLRRTSVASVLSHRPISPTHALYTTQQRRTQTGNRASAPHSPSTAKPSKPADQSLNPTGTGWHCEPDMPDKPGGTDEV